MQDTRYTIQVYPEPTKDIVYLVSRITAMANIISVVKGDITKQDVDAIVNAANTTLLGGGGVDGAIHRAAGPQLLAECKTLDGCPTGQAKITKGYGLPAKWVIHTVGPVWSGGHNNEDELLADCYRNSLALAIKHSIKTIAFPSISTGAYRFPVEQAAQIALKEIRGFLDKNQVIEKVIIVCFDDKTYETYLTTLRILTGSQSENPERAKTQSK